MQISVHFETKKIIAKILKCIYDRVFHFFTSLIELLTKHVIDGFRLVSQRWLLEVCATKLE